MSAEFTELKARTEALLVAYRQLKNAPPPPPDPAPADITALTAEINSELPPA